MIFYLKNTEGYKMDFFKGEKYDEILLIFQAKFNANMRFLFKSREEMAAKDEEIIKSINETPAQKAAKRRKLSEEAQEAEDVRKRLEIIVVIDDKPRYKIKRADDTHQLYISFTTLLKNFDREDLEVLWKIVRDRFSTSKPTNFLDEYLLLTLKIMFEEPDGQDAIWRNQKSVHGLALVKRWKLYPLSRFTLEQLVNVARLQVKEESEMSLELLSERKDCRSNVNAASLRLKLFKDVVAAADAKAHPIDCVSFVLEEYSEEEIAEIMAETMEQYMSKTRADYGPGVVRPKIKDKDHFELKGQFLKERRDNTLSGSKHEDANEYIEKDLEIVDLFHIPNIAQDQVMLTAFPMSLTGAMSCWLRNKPSEEYSEEEIAEIMAFLKELRDNTLSGSKHEDANEHIEKDLEIVDLFHIPNIAQDQVMLTSFPMSLTGAASCWLRNKPSEMAEYSQKWHNGTSRTRSTETSDELATIQAQLNNLGREIKKVNENFYGAPVGCEQSKGPYYTKDCPLKEEGKTLEEAYYT
nr:hypothetical protein [Tanacetum cinerariifolium]